MSDTPLDCLDCLDSAGDLDFGAADDPAVVKVKSKKGNGSSAAAAEPDEDDAVARFLAVASASSTAFDGLDDQVSWATKGRECYAVIHAVSWPLLVRISPWHIYILCLFQIQNRFPS